MYEKGREVLAKAGMVETHSLLMPITQEIGQCLPGELTALMVTGGVLQMV
jgi:hypothetical protein